MVLLLRTTPVTVLRLPLLMLILGLTACNPIYVIQAGITQSEILLNRREITEVLEDPETSEEIRRKLTLVQEAREFTSQLALEPGGTFQSYSALDRDTLAWIVLAAKPDSFSFHTWWFPIVGSVPYKGFFSPESARSEALSLQQQGYETLVRGTEAFSTLGWFNDPVMTPMLRNADHDVVNTVIHEVLHTTLWIPNHVAFNESLANFVGHQGAIAFFTRQEKTNCASGETPACTSSRASLTAARLSMEQSLDISRTLSALVPKLRELYQSEISREEKLTEREKIFASCTDPLRARIPGLKILKKAHNAELMQLQLYYTKLPLFLEFWSHSQELWPTLLENLKVLADKSQDSGQEPFELLEQTLGRPSAPAEGQTLP